MAQVPVRPVRGGLPAFLVLAGSGIAGGVLLASCSAPANGTATPREPEVIYDTTCGYCHGHNVGPIIRGRQLPAETIEFFVRNGSGAMPAFKPTEISPQELSALSEWISTSKADSTEHGQ
ncbi:cytochrome c [Altericroceibacterium spongiae]|uniref:Cytochrome c n=1 Tax=Altericroceibacterium spongiae TaxID=2320269 RepID=A0A420EAG2_9SPHN|nr:cytochrome c [Altericroceibacterium spongiae]RKF17673.1 cytochrome c [Altericroceibacterium spongiae]